MAKSEYLIETLLKQDISIHAGKYESDRLNLEMARLADSLDNCVSDSDEGFKALNECKLLFQELIGIMNN